MTTGLLAREADSDRNATIEAPAARVANKRPLPGAPDAVAAVITAPKDNAEAHAPSLSARAWDNPT